VNGNIKAEGRLELKNPCSIVGDMSAQTLVVEEGVSIRGNISTGGDRIEPLMVAGYEQEKSSEEDEAEKDEV
jgi:cytoskeletal protein CcmA (bactofilin family)